MARVQKVHRFQLHAHFELVSGTVPLEQLGRGGFSVAVLKVLGPHELTLIVNEPFGTQNFHSVLSAMPGGEYRSWSHVVDEALGIAVIQNVLAIYAFDVIMINK